MSYNNHFVQMLRNYLQGNEIASIVEQKTYAQTDYRLSVRDLILLFNCLLYYLQYIPTNIGAVCVIL